MVLNVRRNLLWFIRDPITESECLIFNVTPSQPRRSYQDETQLVKSRVWTESMVRSHVISVERGSGKKEGEWAVKGVSSFLDFNVPSTAQGHLRRTVKAEMRILGSSRSRDATQRFATLAKRFVVAKSCTTTWPLQLNKTGSRSFAAGKLTFI